MKYQGRSSRAGGGCTRVGGISLAWRVYDVILLMAIACAYSLEWIGCCCVKPTKSMRRALLGMVRQVLYTIKARTVVMIGSPKRSGAAESHESVMLSRTGDGTMTSAALERVVEQATATYNDWWVEPLLGPGSCRRHRCVCSVNSFPSFFAPTRTRPEQLDWLSNPRM